MFGSKVKKESSSTEMGLARLDTRLDQVSSLYESLAVRIANLEAGGMTTRPEQGHPETDRSRGAVSLSRESPTPVQHRASWFRILRHMWPHKMRMLLSEHDAYESLQSELRLLELRKRIRAYDNVVASPDGPAFPAAIFHADVDNKVTIIDVGAQDLESEDHIYTPLQAAGATTIIGFEPLPDKDSAPRRADPNVKMLEHFVGTGEAATFHVTQFDPASSLFKPNHELLSEFVDLSEMCTTIASFEVQTTRLDDITEITDCDYLKIDVQGGELDALKGAQHLLESTLVVHCEVEFGPVYKNQPLFADVDSFLRESGFELIDFINPGYNRYRALPGTVQTGSRLLWAEAIYFKSADKILQGKADNLLKTAYIAHVNYGMYDLAAHFLAKFDGAKGSSMLRSYLAGLAAFDGWKPGCSPRL